MSGLPYAKFYPGDWMRDPCVRRCSYAARGLWMDLLCLMFEGEGYLRFNGRGLSLAEVARMTCGGRLMVARLIAELERNGVFSRTEDGTIYSRRIVRDVAKAKEDQENGRKGGNPALKNGVNPPDKPSHNGEDKVARGKSESSSETKSLTEGQRDLVEVGKIDDGKIARGPWGPRNFADDDKGRVAQLERQVRNLYPADAERLIAYSLGEKIQNREGYLGRLVTTAKVEHPPPKPAKPLSEVDALRAELIAAGVRS